MKILVTGVAGFIGSALTLKLLERGDVVLGIDNLNDYYDVALKKARLARLETREKFSFELLDIAQEPERSRRSDPADEGVEIELVLERLLADGGVIEIDSIADGEPVGRDDLDPLASFVDLDRFLETKNGDGLAEQFEPRGVDEMGERQSAAVDDGHFRAVDVDVEIGDAVGYDRAEEVLHRSDGGLHSVRMAEKQSFEKFLIHLAVVIIQAAVLFFIYGLQLSMKEPEYRTAEAFRFDLQPFIDLVGWNIVDVNGFVV